MKIRLKYVLFLLALLFVNCIMAQQVQVESPVRFLALGDSYTIGQGVPEKDRWPVQLANRLQNQGVAVEEVRIIAQTGWRTGNLLSAINAENPEPNYNLVSLLIGVNNQFQRTDIAIYPVEFKQLLNKAIELCGGRKSGVFVLSIPDYGYTPFGAAARATISAEIDEYNRINREIANELGVAYFNITPISREAVAKPEYLAPDQLHPSGEMYARWVSLLLGNNGIKINTTSVSEVAENHEVKVFPNPATSRVSFVTPVQANEIAVYSSSGAKVYSGDIENSNTFSLNVAGWEPGFYIFRIKNAKEKFDSGKFWVE